MEVREILSRTPSNSRNNAGLIHPVVFPVDCGRCLLLMSLEESSGHLAYIGDPTDPDHE